MTALTEAEAKTKWCHRAPTGLLGHPHAMCIGSGCMAWRCVAHNPQRRWRVEWRGETTTYFWNPSTHPEYADAKVEEMEPDAEPRGFCGLAGQP